MSTKRKAPGKIAQPTVKKEAKKPVRANISEVDTAVSNAGLSTANGDDVVEISSDAASSDYDDSDAEQQDDQFRDAKAKTINQDHDQDTEMAGVDGESDPEQEPAANTFGDLARANETIDVPAALLAQQTNALAAPERSLAPPNSSSLGTVLTQALRTDDTDLLESCLHTTNVTTISNTIQRLDSSLAGVLLNKLAARMHRRPGRAGSLMNWVQWTLIAHGGALAMQPGVAKQLGELHQVLEERSRGLSSLMSLKGKLDLLDMQMKLRQKARQNAGQDDEFDQEDDEGIVYIEGEESDADVGGAMDFDDDDEMPVTNGIMDGSDSDGEDVSSNEDDEDDGFEGEEELDENEVNHDDVESEDEDSEMEAVPPAKRSKTVQSSKRR